MLRFFENIIEVTSEREVSVPPKGLIAFYLFFLKQVQGIFIGLLMTGLVLAVIDVAVPVFVGRIIHLVTTIPHERFFDTAWLQLLAIGGAVMLLRPAVMLMVSLLEYQAVVPGLTNLVRWQSHRHVIRQNLSYFQSEFAGRIGNRIMATGYALRASALSVVSVVWYLLALSVAGIAVMGSESWWLSSIVLIWASGYLLSLYLFIPKIGASAEKIGNARSAVVGKMVDSYTNIIIVKLFSRLVNEDAYIKNAMDNYNDCICVQMRWFTVLSTTLAMLSGFLVVATTAVALVLWSRNEVGLQTIATVLPLTLQISAVSARTAYEVTTIFEQIGTVHDGMSTIAKPIGISDHPQAVDLAAPGGRIEFRGVSFGYGQPTNVVRDVDLTIEPGEKVGLVGHSGAGKSTLINLLLRFYEPASGRILIDGKDIALITQTSLRSHFSVVTQDTSLLHRSIFDNIRYGRPEATFEEVVEAAQSANAHDFIEKLEDSQGQKGYEAYVGERGLNLSGGQRQRIAIARAILTNSPILILDEATSALDSVVEAEIQESLEALMAGRTVIAIAHRLSTIARMDRLAVIKAGRIVEQGSHSDLLSLDGNYARLWKRQVGHHV